MTYISVKLSKKAQLAKGKKPKVKAKTISFWKKKAWTEFSIWVRKITSTPDGIQECITCGVYKHWKQLQAGHFIPGRHSLILFDERGVHPQCYHCNVGLKGNPRKYDAYMRLEYGTVVIRDLERLDMVNKQFTIPELQEIFEKYQLLNIAQLRTQNANRESNKISMFDIYERIALNHKRVSIAERRRRINRTVKKVIEEEV